MTDTIFAGMQGRLARPRRARSFVVRALFGNVALLSGLVAMPVVIAVGYLLGGS